MIKMTMVYLNRSLSMKYKRNEYITFTLFDRGLYIYIYILYSIQSRAISLSSGHIECRSGSKKGNFCERNFRKIINISVFGKGLDISDQHFMLQFLRTTLGYLKIIFKFKEMTQNNLIYLS
jgi:hypothetical protein